MTNIQIAVKVRPLIERELRDKVEHQWLVKANSIVHIDSAQNFLGEPYSFDHIFDQNTSNKEVYDTVVKPLVMSCLEGINSTIFAYGQTSSGKTHTMLGDKDVPGIIIFTVQDIFKHIEEATNKNFLLRCSYLEIYNEKINDLLNTEAKDLKIREDYDQGVHVSVKEEVIRESSELFMLMRKGMKTRKIGCTDMNERSSRSHTIFKLIIQSQSKDSEGSYTESSLSLVDLAGSERVGQMRMKGERQAEGVSINKSLTTLGLVIRKLSENEPFINYRDSKLTRLLQHSLGGNSKTLIICTITVAAAEETKSTLEFAQRAKYVKNRPIINERVTDKDQLKQYENMCQDYKGQIERLRLEKLEREKTINALEDKISNIQTFTSGNFGKSVKTSRIPQRRHTLGVYKPYMKNSLAPVLDNEGSDESNEDDDLDIMKHESNVKSDVLAIMSEDDNVFDADTENINSYADTVAITPAKWLTVPKSPKTPKTPSPILRREKELLEESYHSLKTFTSHENQLRDQYDEIKELKELTEKLRNENIKLREQNIKEGQKHIKIIERNKEIFDQLILLRSVLEGKPKEEIRRRSLHTIMEDDFEMVSDEKDPTNNIDLLDQLSDEIRKNEMSEEKCLKLIEEKQHITKELESMELMFNTLNYELTELKEKHVAITAQNEILKSELESKNMIIEKLKACISEDRNVKEAELDILTKKIKNLNDYKEEMHKQLSDLQKTREEHVNEQNTTLQKELDSLRQEYEDLKQLTEYDTLKIGELEKENQTLKSELETKAELEQQLTHLREKIKSLEETELEISDLRVVVQLQSQTIIDLEKKNDKFKSNTEVRELQELNAQKQEEKDSLTQQFAALTEALEIKENKIKELERSLKKSTNKWEKYNEEFTAMKEKYEGLEQDQLDMEKKVENLTQCKFEYTTIVNHIKEVLGEDIDIIEFVNMLKALRDDNDDLRSKLESSEKQIESLNNEFDILNKKICGTHTDGVSTLSMENQTLKNRILELENNYRNLQEDYDKCLLKIKDLNGQISTMEKEIIENAAAKDKLTVLMVEVTDVKKTLNAQGMEISELTEKSACLHDDLEKKLAELETQKKDNDALRSQLAEYHEEVNRCSALQKENERLKLEMEDAIFQLSGEQKEVEKLSQQVEENLLVVASYEKEISHLNDQITKLKIENSQQFENITLSLKENIDKKEAELKTLKERYHEISQENTDIKHQLEEYIIQFNENNMKINSLHKDYDDKNNKLKSLENQDSELKIRLVQLEQQNAELKEMLTKIPDLENCLTKHIEEVDMLKDKCSSQELQLKNYKEELNRKSEEIEFKNKLYSDIEDTCTKQEQMLQTYKDQLDNKITEVNEKSELYNNILTTYAAKDEEIVRLEMERNELLEQQLEFKDVQQKLAERIEYIKDLESERANLQRRLESHVALQQTLDNYLEEFSKLKTSHDTLQAEHCIMKNQLKDKNEELKHYNSVLQSLDVKTKENERLITEIKQLTNQVLSLSQKQISLDALLQDMKHLELEKNNLTDRVDELSREKTEINLQVLVRTSHLSTKQEEITYLRELLEQKSVEMERLEKGKDRISAKMDLALKNLMDMKRTLHNRSEELSHLKGQYNALEVQFHDCKDSSKSKIQELEKQVKNSEHLNRLIKDTGHPNEILVLEKKNTELVTQLESTTLKLNQIQDDYKLKTVQLRTASEEIQRLKQNIVNCNSLQTELEQYKMKLQKIHKNYEGNVTLLKNAATNLTHEKQAIQKKLSDSERKVLALSNELSMVKQRKDESLQTQPELQAFKERVSSLENQVKLEKSKTDSLIQKLRSSEAEVDDLQIKVNDLEQYKKKMQDKLCEGVLKEIPVPRLSDEGRPLSPNEVRKIKRQSIHDQRRGLVTDSGDSLNSFDQDCLDCKEQKARCSSLEDQIKQLKTEIEELKKENTFLDKESEEMLKIIKELEQSENDLHDKLQQCKNLTGNDTLLQRNYEEVAARQTELEKELLQNKKLITEYKNLISDLECRYTEMESKHGKIEKDLKRKLSDYQSKAMKTPPSVENKGTQATCELHQKYKMAKKLAQMRRQEGNYLRAKLNLPPDCPVLPEDLQRQPTSV